MFVNSHARARLTDRLPAKEAQAIIDRLEASPGDPGVLAIIVAHLRGEKRGRQFSKVHVEASNGDTVVAIVDEGEVTTVYYRRSWNQRLDAAGLGVERVVSWT